MIQIYKASNTDYENNGNSVLYPTSCEVEMNLNGVWLLELRHPLDEESVFKFITNGAVICAPTPIGEKQLFRIYNVIKTDTEVTASARPIFMDSAGDAFLIDTRPTAKNGQEALDIMMAGTKYSGQSDISKVATSYYIRKNLIEAIAGSDENSFLTLWGGEVLYDNYKIIINERVGGDYGVSAIFGRNLAGIEEEIDTDGVLTRIVPVAFNGHTLGGNGPFVDSQLIDKYPVIHTQVVKFEDVKLTVDAQEDEQSFATLELLQEELRRLSNLMFADGCDKPTCQYKVDIVNLEDTEEYKDYKILEKIGLGDTIHCKHKRLGIETEQRVISIKYDCILKRNIEETLGDAQADYFDELTTTYEHVNDVIDKKNGNLIAEKVSGILDGMNTQLRYQKDVAKKQDVRAILFEDLDVTSPLYGSLAIGSQGIQIANKRTADGRDWDWTTAITANGANADALITGLLTDKAGRNFWNLDTGEMQVSGEGFTVDGERIGEIIDKAKTLTAALTNEYQLVYVNHDGSGADYTECNTRIYVMLGQLEVTASAKYTITPSEGVTGHWDNTRKVYQVTNITGNEGYIDFAVQYATLSARKRMEVCKIQAGKEGEKGTDGVGIKSTKVTYQSSANGAVIPTGTWIETIPAVQENQYLWTRTVVTLTSGVDSASYSVGKMGATGKKGDTGASGVGIKNTSVTYKAGESGTSAPTGLWTSTIPTVPDGQYLWTRTVLTRTDSTETTSYSVSRSGTDGADGAAGRVYMLTPNVAMAKLKMDGYPNPQNLTFNAYYRDGATAARTPYAGRFIIEVTEDDVTYVKAYESSTNETEISYNLMTALNTGTVDEFITAGDVDISVACSITGVRCTLYAAGGTSQKLDTQSVPVVYDFEGMTAEDIFNLLTDYGKIQGLYMKDNQLYINASYIQSGELSVGMVMDGINGISDFVRLIKDGLYSVRADGSVMTSINGYGFLLHDYEKNEADRQRLLGGLHTSLGMDGEKSFQIDLHESDFLDFIYNTGVSNLTAMRFYPNTKFVSKIGWYLFTEFCLNNYKMYFGQDYKNYLQNLSGAACIATENTFAIAHPSGGGFSYIMGFSSSEITAYKKLNMNGWQIVNQSDQRLKRNIKETQVQALEVIKEIQLYEYDWIETEKHDDIGYVADQLEEISKGFVAETENGIKGTVDHEIIKYLVKGVQELTERVETLEGTNKLRSRIQRQRWETNYTDEEKQQFVDNLVAERIKKAAEMEREYVTVEGEDNGASTKKN